MFKRKWRHEVFEGPIRLTGRSMQVLSVLLTGAMLCMSLRPLSAAAQTQQSQTLRMQASRPAPPRPLHSEEKLALTLAALDASLAHPSVKSGADATELATLREKLTTLDREAMTDFARAEQTVKSLGLGPEFLKRHQGTVAQYRARMTDLQSRLDIVARGGDEAKRGLARDEARKLIAKTRERPEPLPMDPRRLPFHAPEGKTREPLATTKDLQARLFSKSAPDASLRSTGESAAPEALAAPTPGDLSATDDVQLTQAIRDLADSLEHHPVRIYNWVRNNIRFLPTYGSVQGSAMTLASRQGNAFDTASLLIALLRASNIPARYVYGTVRVPAAQAMNWVGGVSSPQAVQDLMGQGGIPNVAIIQGNRITHLQVEHIWVEAWVDFTPSRGAIHKQGDTWVPLDASFKQHTFTAPMDLAKETSIDYGRLTRAMADAAQTSPQGGMTGLYPDYVRKTLEDALAETQDKLGDRMAQLTPEDVLGSAKVVAEDSTLLAGALPYQVVARGASPSALPPGLRASVSLTLYASQLDRAYESPELTYSVSLPVLNSRRLGVHYRPATPGDAQLIQSYVNQGARSLPVYLIRVVPEVQLDGVVVAQGSAVTMGTQQVWDLSLQEPGRASPPDAYEVIAGSEVVFGVNGNGVTRKVLEDRFASHPSDSAAENLHEVSLTYWYQHDLFDGIAASTHRVHTQRLPSAGLFSTPMEVRYWFGLPRSGTFASYVMDVQRVTVAVTADSAKQQVDFMSQAGLQGSYLEGSVFEQLFRRFQGTGQSTAQVLVDAAADNIPIYRIDASNVDTVLPQLSISEDVRSDIVNGVAAGKRVTIPQRAPRGVTGYIVQDPATGAAAYLIEGGLNGGRQSNCQEEPEPVRVPSWLADLFLALLLLAVLAAVIYIAVQSGGVLAPQAASVFLAVAGGSLLFSGNAYAAQRTPCCTVKPVPHLGGDPFHNLCADLIGPNDNPGMDANVDGRNFDAVTDNAVLWEVKTYNLANCTTSFCLTVLLPRWVAETNAQLQADKVLANECGYMMAFGAGDGVFAAMISPTAYDVIAVNPSICLHP
ncbi:transglutaminase domain-containing protein [Pyxidicoccus parkwayensis]|uniref:Transglutaminase domain-containing protein n=1 Tax=Pyxidicoccus parkwayensis TaxID=2813578 RepID=A0ABX7P1M9_9BACT|nr:DUF6310 domain-containing protein [Pyxidicoccus parkwaysis]QSQ23977.1 transglutaminase domain-containing protein [Pyxidicoccus parkwaysis]